MYIACIELLSNTYYTLCKTIESWISVFSHLQYYCYYHLIVFENSQFFMVLSIPLARSFPGNLTICAQKINMVGP